MAPSFKKRPERFPAGHSGAGCVLRNTAHRRTPRGGCDNTHPAQPLSPATNDRIPKDAPQSLNRHRAISSLKKDQPLDHLIVVIAAPHRDSIVIADASMTPGHPHGSSHPRDSQRTLSSSALHWHSPGVVIRSSWTSLWPDQPYDAPVTVTSS